MAKLLSRMKRSAHVAFGRVAALAAMAIGGGAVDLPMLRDFGADFAPMSAPAALGFLLLAGSFLASERGRRASAYAAAGLCAALAVAALADHYLHLALQIDIAPAASVTLLVLALVTPLPRGARAFGVPVHGAAAALIVAGAVFALLGRT